MIVGLLPASVFCGNSLLVSVGNMGAATTLYVQAVMNSFVADFALRQMVSANVNMFYVYQVPVPRLAATHPAYKALVERAARLICTTPEFDDLAKAVGLSPVSGAGPVGAGIAPEPIPSDSSVSSSGSPSPGEERADKERGPGGEVSRGESPASHAQLRAEIDGIVAHLYGLTRDEFAYILTTFPLVKDPVKNAALAAFDAIGRGEIARLGDDPAVAELRDLVARGETDGVEFKAGAKFNPFTRKADDSMIRNIVEAVAAFLNTDGGTLLIGVRDDKSVAGLADDFACVNAQKPGPDSYELFLRNAIGSKVGVLAGSLWRARFDALDGETVCRIVVKPSPEAVYVDGDLLIRDGGKKQKVKAQDVVSYLSRRFEKGRKGEGAARKERDAPGGGTDAAIDYIGGEAGLFSTQTKLGVD